ncbi:MAG: ribonuclease P protein component [Clostridia bacterium]|nr:ribonuclease P protein component [Clostridia bacterium]
MKLRAIRENHLYSKAYARGKKFVGRNVVVYVLPDYAAKKLAKANPTKEKINRVGITVTKKLGGAVIRNRAKRIIREGYRLCDKKSPIKRGFLIVIVARSGIIRAKSTDIESDLSAAFRKLSMYVQ